MNEGEEDAQVEDPVLNNPVVANLNQADMDVVFPE